MIEWGCVNVENENDAFRGKPNIRVTRGKSMCQYVWKVLLGMAQQK